MAPCRSYRAFRRHIKKHQSEWPAGAVVSLCCRVYGSDWTWVKPETEPMEFEAWLEYNGDYLALRAAETGEDRDPGFDPGAYEERQYVEYLSRSRKGLGRGNR